MKEAKKSFAKFVNSLFAFILVVGLMPTWALSNPTPAFAAPNDVTVTTTVDGLASDTLPVLSSAAGDFTVGQAVNADPVNYTDANGNTPVANLAEQQAEKGLSLKWVDAETGADFDWNSTKVNRSTVVNGIWTQTQCSVTVSANDGGKTADTVVTVPWGKSYASVEGSAPQAPSRDGWQFLGWYTQDDQQYNFNSAVKESVVVEAKWAVADVTIVPTTNPTSDVPQSISGTCWIGATWSLHPAQFALSNFTGYLSGCTATGSCADRSAAQPTNVQANYTATLNSINTETGEVVYDVYITPPGVTDGHSRNQFGLIGYQHVSAQVKLIKNFGGWVEINKSSANTDITDGNGCYSLEGAEYAVYNADNQAVDKLTTDANGYAKSKLLPSGTYTIKELKAPNGYGLDEEPHGIEIKSGQTTTSNLKDQPQSDPVGTLLGKYDGEKTYSGEKNLPLGSASLYGAQYSVEYYDGYYDSVADAEASGDPTRKWVLQTDEDGYVNLRYADQSFEVHDADGNVTATLPYKVSGDDFYRAANGAISLPLGTVVIKEIKAPKGYNLPQPFGMDQSFVRQITVDGNIDIIHSYNTPEQAEPVFRSDLEFTKAASDDAHSLANVPFKITSKTTGESHVIVTDENGKASTKASWNKHTENTNGNDWVMTENADGVQGFIAKLLDTGKTLDSTSGVWFGQYQDGDETKITDPDDERGALPYDEYTLEELPCAANDGYQLIKKDFTVSRDNTFNADNTVNLGTLTDQDISISTQASDKADGDQEVVAEPDVTIVDKVSCDNLSKGTEYIINGTLMDKATGKAYVDASGNEIHGSTTFTAKSQEQDVFVEFNFDGSNLTDSTDLVVFETIAATEAPDRILDTHENLDDRGQTITVKPPAIGTIATDGVDNDKDVVKDTQVTVKDTVAYVGLTVGKEYTLKGELMDKATGTVLTDADGNPVTAETKFTPKTTAGTVDIEFNFDGSNLKDGDTLVAFEHVVFKDKEIASHTEIGDIAQSVTVSEPKLGTTAVDAVDEDKNIVKDPEASVVDTVEYSGLVPGREYTVSGTLMDKATGKAYIDPTTGKEITGSTTFTPKDTYGTIDVKFSFDASQLEQDAQLVVFESLQREGKEVGGHKEIDDEAQAVTVIVPEVHTTATDGLDGDKEVPADHKATVVDAVQYKDLVPGKEYTVSGTLMVKETGEALLDADGNPVTGSTTFTPEKPEGSVDVVFEFDADLLAGKKLVAFEKLLRNDIEITFHEDIDDEDQTVEVVPPEVGTTATDTADGDKHMSADPESSITDEIAYKNLIPGDKYQVAGILMDKSTGLPLLSGEGASAISTEDLQKFADDLKAACGLGSGDVSAIEIDGKAFGEGFEVTASNGSYSYTDVDGVQHVLAKSDDGWKLSEVKDSSTTEVATYTDDQVKLTKDAPALPLSPDYEAIAKVMQENPDIVSCLSIQKKTFTPEEQSGTVSMDFPINSIYNEDTDTVVFEFLFKGSELIANESDLGNEGQTVSIVTPKLSTTATDKTDGDHTLLPSREATVVDHVEYTDLIPGKEYTVSGTLMDKSTGEPLVVGDGNVTAETTFVPNKADGTVDLEFTFDASELGGKDLVAFEIAYKDGIQIADHQDIDDEAQTVTVSEPDDNTFDTPGGDGYSKTGVDMTLIYALIAALVALAGGAGAYAYRHRKLAAAEGKTDSESDEE
ncbi:hypothetical protein CE91St62_23930 [Lachnospiraceae bacterium]|uniref:VaFE repeat-containing surface-anchored protein n=1 Tax=Extibacter sp. GGCC_0201 TaxID=2731209 RepID=UPI001AA17A18|nr:VaFE repeat-containing surface-anchored protein [Extibacter sp. GGCC_0201]MBO1721258.1 VaFE repeat-containing surface-anchored protein [Extibacter sp. GGCC_0201]BDF34328.1 hypothetical protein CE91St61_24030 [Lachnospiraceae bacterium]BDF38332.1 hypothetical protein CE91St62_23930 [Lachnospiraceae bacterium]